MSSDGNIKTYNGTTVESLQTYTTNTWYTIKLVIDTYNDIYDIYVDDTLRGSGYSLRNAAADVAKLKFYFSDSPVGTMHIDDIDVYRK